MKINKLLILLSHNDDEFFFLSLIKKYIESGASVYIDYLTHGSLYNIDHSIRMNESIGALLKLGVPRDHIYSTGHTEDVLDSTLDMNMLKILNAVDKKHIDKKIDCVFTMAWEGGNTDHDATAAVAYLLGNRWNIKNNSIYEVPSYNADTKIPFYFNIMNFPKGNTKGVKDLISFEKALWMLSFIIFYKSQRKTFIGLFPGIIFQLIFRRKVVYRTLEKSVFSRRPHSGPLLYESRFGKNFELFKIEIFKIFNVENIDI